jgi:hypothetical protein
MENQTNKSEATPATHNPRNVFTETGSTGGHPWVGLHVEPEAGRVLDAELIWIGVAGRGFDFDRAERLCAARKVYRVVFQYDGTTIETDYADAETFADFVAGCRDELALNPPTFDGEAEEKVIRDTIRLLYAESERLALVKGGRA